MNFKEFADTFMKEFFMEVPSRENCDKMWKLVWAYLWSHPEFEEHKESVFAFWKKVGNAWEERNAQEELDAWEERNATYYTDGKELY